MRTICSVCMIVLASLNLSFCLVPISHSSALLRSANIKNCGRGSSKSQLNSFVDFSTALIAVGDYAAEIEKGVGEEIYAPIFKSGLVLFGSGLISAFMAAAIIAKSDSWEELGLEFERGKVAQLIELDVKQPSSVASSSNFVAEPVVPVPLTKSEKISAENVLTNADGVYDLDL